MSDHSKRKPLSNAEVKEILGKLDIESTDQIQKRTIDYLMKFTKTSDEQAQTMIKNLIKSCKLTEEEAVEIVNIMPHSLEELRVFTSGWKKLLPTEALEKMLNILAQKKK
tara:strand:- start:378 stop:707 length:330 start_codon:yes stop_codon:yes gene_type:complete